MRGNDPELVWWPALDFSDDRESKPIGVQKVRWSFECDCAGRMNVVASMRAVLILLALSAVPVVCLSAESPVVPQEPEAGEMDSKAEASRSLAEIPTAMAALEAGQRRLRLLLAEDPGGSGRISAKSTRRNDEART